MGRGEGLQEKLEARMASQRVGQCCTLIYTSGTTGKPKAVMISHDNCTWTGRVTVEHLQLGADEHLISYLPLSHIAAQMIDIYAPICTSATLHFAQPDALRGSLLRTLQEVRPTAFFAVPRVWEKVMEGIKAKAPPADSVMAKISRWAKGVGKKKYYAEQNGDSRPLMYPVAKIIFKKVRKQLGLDRCRTLLTGAAPISTEVLEYFGQLDMNVMELFGMSEVTGPTNISVPGQHRTGYCGPVLPGMETIVLPDTGEICFTGRHVMMGYMHNAEATEETIDADGYLHSGDIGEIDAGLLKITGRIKELIITAGGENVAPVPIEDAIKKHFPAVSNVMVVGDKRKFLTAVLTLKSQPTDDGLGFTDQLMGDALKVDGSEASTVSQAIADSVFQAYLDAGIKAANVEAVSNAQKVGKFVIAPVDFSVDGGELTATMKLRRKVVAEKYSELIEGMYA